MNFPPYLSLIILLGIPAWGADAPARDLIGEALPILQKSYADFSGLNYQASDKLADFVTRSKGGIELVASRPPAPAAMFATTLPDGVIYWRAPSFLLPGGKNPADLAAQLKQPATRGLILDLRSNTAPDDYDGARRWLAMTDTVLPRIVLTNRRTTGAAEALAGCLQAHGAVVVGQATAGQVAAFAEAPLSSGQMLRYRTTPDPQHDPLMAFRFRDEKPVWGQPVMPDVTPNVDDHNEKAALVLIGDNRIDEVIGESPARHRMSEAALLKNQDPEYDNYLASLEDKPVLLSLPVVHDAALIAALDSLKAIRVSQIDAPAPPAASETSQKGVSVQ